MRSALLVAVLLAGCATLVEAGPLLEARNAYREATADADAQAHAPSELGHVSA